uniref:Uncharacterized protein n=1 Tax=viral metagenome TaxID=1070528 RepID=A0A6C0JWL4_9ZZZZ
MQYTRVTSSTLPKPIESRKVTLVWGNDGWCYIPQLSIRRKFTESLYYKEDWLGVIAMPEYIEEIEWTKYPNGMWKENNEVFSLGKQS